MSKYRVTADIECEGKLTTDDIVTFISRNGIICNQFILSNLDKGQVQNSVLDTEGALQELAIYSTWTINDLKEILNNLCKLMPDSPKQDLIKLMRFMVYNDNLNYLHYSENNYDQFIQDDENGRLTFE